MGSPGSASASCTPRRELLGVSRVDVLGFGDSGMSGDAGPTTVVGADPADRG